MRIAAAILVMVIASAALAQQAGMMGAGIGTCADYTLAYRQDPASANDLYFSWAQGYMSGQNVGRDKKPMHDLHAITIGEQLEHLKRLCDKNPQMSFAMAAQYLFNALPTLPP